jgi:hypothetical protein
MCLTAVMGLVHEQMGKHMSCEIALDATFAAVHGDGCIAAGCVEPVAKRDQSHIAAALALGKRCDVVGLQERSVVGRQIRVAVQRADVVEIDGQNVIERCGKTREEADAGRVKIGTRQIRDRSMQAPARESIGVRLDAKRLGQIHASQHSFLPKPLDAFTMGCRAGAKPWSPGDTVMVEPAASRKAGGAGARDRAAGAGEGVLSTRGPALRLYCS